LIPVRGVAVSRAVLISRSFCPRVREECEPGADLFYEDRLSDDGYAAPAKFGQRVIDAGDTEAEAMVAGVLHAVTWAPAVGGDRPG
jgi:hypothetical protein